MIKILTDLKRTIQSKTPFQIVQHALYPECSGRICTVGDVKNKGFFAVSQTDPKDGIWMEFGKTSDWTFAEDSCYYSFQGQEVFCIRFLQEKKISLFARVDSFSPELSQTNIRILIDYAYQYGEPSMEEREAVGSILKTCWPRNSGYIPGCILDEAAEKLGMHLEHGCSDINF